MAHILPDQPPRDWRDTRMASPAPLCPHGVPYAQRCTSCGWTCPTCKRAYAPWVRECNYSHEAPAPVVPVSEPAEPAPIYVPLRAGADVTPSRMADIAHMLTHVAPQDVEGKFVVLPPGSKAKHP